MPDYQKSKIYKLVSNKTEDIYIGACLVDLCKRLSGHKSQTNTCSSRKLFKDDAIVTIVLIENFPCNSKNEMKARELFHITNNECININKPFITDKQVIRGEGTEWRREYYESNKEAMIKHQKAYNEANKEEVSGQQKEYYEANKEALLEYQKAYTEANKEAILEYKKAYREANKEAISKHMKEYREANKERLKQEYKNKKAKQ